MTFNKAKALRQAEKHVQQGKINAAVEDYAKIAEFDPADLTVVNTLGDLLVRAGRVEEAIVNFGKIAENYRENGFTLKAIAMFKKISKLDPQNVDISLKLATLYSAQGLLVEARQQYLQVADYHAKNGKTQKALDVYQKIADLDPENTSVRLKLAETYLRENLRDQAHDAFVAAGSELIRKNKVPQGLQACLSALQINPDSKPALTAVSEAYIAQGQAEKAIDLLKDAFDKNPGDVDLITILGRTYLAAGMMNEAEGTFTTLVQLDKSRYEFVLEVGRKFAEFGMLDRAAEQLDACIDVLISRREEDKAIDFLHTLLDRNVDHVPSLQRLADIYQRIREDHNLVGTLESLVEAAVRTGLTGEAIQALKRLVSIEPENPVHRQRLQSLGVNTDEISALPTTGHTARRAAGFADPTIDRDIADAARMGRAGDIPSAIMILEQVVDRAPDSAEAREHLRELYTAQRMNDRAATQCRELARIYASQNEIEKSNRMADMADQLGGAPAFGFATDAGASTGGGFEFDLGGGSAPEPPPAAGGGGFAPSGGDWSFGEAGGFDFSAEAPAAAQPAASAGAPAAAAGAMSDSALRDELEGVDFYIAQGYLEIARDTLDRLSGAFPNNPEIKSRYAKLKSTAELKAQMDQIGTGGMSPAEEPAQPTGSEFDLSSMFNTEAPAPSPFSTNELPPIEQVQGTQESGFDFSSPFEFGAPAPDAGAQMFDVKADSAPLAPPAGGSSVDLSDQFNFTVEPEPAKAAAPAPPAEPEAASESVILDDLLGDLDDQFSAIETRKTGAPLPVQETTVEPDDAVPQGASTPLELREIFDEFKNSFDADTAQDYDTHYNLGIAYRDMELFDDAVEEFQSAFRATSPTAPDGRFIQCCNMLGLCFMAKDMPRLAVMWFKKGLDAPNRAEDEYQALRFDLGLAYERLGDLDKAMDVFSEVYAIDINYRNVGEKLRELQSSRGKG